MPVIKGCLFYHILYKQCMNRHNNTLKRLFGKCAKEHCPELNSKNKIKKEIKQLPPKKPDKKKIKKKKISLI